MYLATLIKKTEEGYEKVIIKSADDDETLSEYMFGNSARMADEIPYTLAGNMYGVTITFEPQSDKNKDIYIIEDGIINKYISSETKTLKENPYLCNEIRGMVGNMITLTSQTYRNSEFTVFIGIGSEKDPTTVTGQFSGTHLVNERHEYTIANDREIK